MTIEAWEITRTLEEVETMADLLLDKDRWDDPEWADGMSKMMGGECAWPLMVRVPKFIAEGREVTTLEAMPALEHLDSRLDFLIEKAEDQRGLSAPKAREQVNMLLWLFGREGDMIPADAGFESTARLAHQLQKKVKEAIS